MAMRKIVSETIVTVAIIGMVASILAVLVASQTFNNSASIKTVGVGVYSDSTCTHKITSLYWGTLSPGETKIQTIYVKNEGTARILLSMSVGNWTPSTAANYISVAWNRDNSTLNAGNSVSADITLSVSQDITGIVDFTFEITIIGTEAT